LSEASMSKAGTSRKKGTSVMTTRNIYNFVI